MTRTELINMLIKMHGFTSYLEIGCQHNVNFDKINAKYKVSVDPDPKAEAMHQCTSDEFFELFFKPQPPLVVAGDISNEEKEAIAKKILEAYTGRKHAALPKQVTLETFDFNPKFDIIFIDGLHHADQVERDIINSMAALNEWGMIVLHDGYPKEEWQQLVPRMHKVWYGDVWRAFVGFRLKYPDVNSFCLDYDCGLCVIKYTDKKIEPGFVTDMPWEEFNKNSKQLLGVI